MTELVFLSLTRFSFIPQLVSHGDPKGWIKNEWMVLGPVVTRHPLCHLHETGGCHQLGHKVIKDYIYKGVRNKQNPRPFSGATCIHWWPPRWQWEC